MKSEEEIREKLEEYEFYKEEIREVMADARKDKTMSDDIKSYIMYSEGQAASKLNGVIKILKWILNE